MRVSLLDESRRTHGPLQGEWNSDMCFFYSSRRRHTRLQGDWSSDVCSSYSSRRRHTRLQGDWSSDVCSSDLEHDVVRLDVAHGIAHRDIKPDNIVLSPPPQGAVLVDLGKIGRASCRERV